MGEALKTFSFPVGGIADFYLEDHEKKALFKEKAQANFGSDGLGAIQDVAVRMASYGRYGDDKLVHAETGELVVPKALIDKNPKLKESIFGHLKDMGIEDPERYVVGTEANSINPETGLPEFFLKDIFDRVGDVIRKVAKPVLTLAGAAFGPYGAALGAGIGGLIQGESFEKALGSGLTAGAGSALFSGFAPGEGTFLGKVGSSLTTNPLDYAKNVTAPLLGLGGKDLPFIGEAAANPNLVGGTTTFPQAFQKGKDLLMGKTPTPEEILAARAKAGTAAEAKILATNPMVSKTVLDSQKILAGDIAEKALQPSFLRKYGPITALTALGTGFFDKPEQDELEKYKIGQDLIDENRNKFFVQNLQPRRADPPFGIPTSFPLTQAPMQFAAEGGEAGGTNQFPRRNGGIGMDEGTPGKDSVRAMLMPGEFVMTTDAVNGAGGGNNEKGIQNMYAMMRNFEAKARA